MVREPQAGLFGPGSMVWHVNREAVVFLGGGRAALLQLAHPFVAAAIAEHSTTKTDALGRFIRTFENVFAMTFGDFEAALVAARRVHTVHTRITGVLREAVGPYAAGTRYAANTPEALLWVHATLVDTSVQVYELMLRPLTDDEKAGYYAETKRSACLFGIPDDLLPPDWPAFRTYCDRMFASPEITVSPEAADIAGFVLRPPGAPLGPLWDWYRDVTAELLPPRLRAEFGLEPSPGRRRIVTGSLRAMRAGWWLLPRRLRDLPAYVEAQRRLAGRPGPDPVARVLDRALRAARGVPAPHDGTSG